jgi:hypothetical protein
MTTHQLPVRLPVETYEALKAYAEATGESMNAVIGGAVTTFLSDDDRRTEIQGYIEEITARHALALEKLADL